VSVTTAESNSVEWLRISEVMRELGCSRNTVRRLILRGELDGEQTSENGWWRVRKNSYADYRTRRALRTAAMITTTNTNDFAVCGSVWQRPAVQAAFEGGPVQDHLTRRDGPPSE
jgi:hypothetical protein